MYLLFASHRFLLLFLVTSSSSVWGSWTSPFGRSCCSLSSFKTMKSRTINLKRSNIHEWNVNIININYLPKWCAFFFFFFFCGGLSWGSGVSGSLRLSRPSISIAGSGPAVVYWVLYKYKGDQFLYLKEKKQLQNMCSKQYASFVPLATCRGSCYTNGLHLNCLHKNVCAQQTHKNVQHMIQYH